MMRGFADDGQFHMPILFLFSEFHLTYYLLGFIEYRMIDYDIE